jgi:hypothetical protein
LFPFIEQKKQIKFIVALQEIVHVSEAAAFPFAPRGIFSASLTDTGQPRNNGSSVGIVEQIPLNGPEHSIGVTLGEPMESFREDPELDKELYYTVG